MRLGLLSEKEACRLREKRRFARIRPHLESLRTSLPHADADERVSFSRGYQALYGYSYPTKRTYPILSAEGWRALTEAQAILASPSIPSLRNFTPYLPSLLSPKLEYYIDPVSEETRQNPEFQKFYGNFNTTHRVLNETGEQVFERIFELSTKCANNCFFLRTSG